METIDNDKMWPFTDDFIFMMVMQSAGICRDFLRMILPEEDFEEVRVKPQDNPLFIDEAVVGVNEFSVEMQKTLKFAKEKH